MNRNFPRVYLENREKSALRGCRDAMELTEDQEDQELGDRQVFQALMEHLDFRDPAAIPGMEESIRLE